MSSYRYALENDRFVICDGDKVLKTPAGNPVTTLYQPLAERLVQDLNEFGPSSFSAGSVLPWHYTMIDNFASMSHEAVERELIGSFLSQPDWTFFENGGKNWVRVFGEMSTRLPQMVSWLKLATIMQLTAACCIGNAYESLNIAYTLALIVEQYAGEEREEKLRGLAQMIADTYEFGSFSEIYKTAKTFELYYGIHFDEHGPAIKGFELEAEEKDEDEAGEEPSDDEEELYDDDFDIAYLEGEEVSVETLVGRNFYHYTDGELDAEQPLAYSFPDLELELDEESEENEEAEEVDSGLYEVLPDDCWVKRYVDDDDPETCYLLYVALDEDGYINDAGCYMEVKQSSGLSLLFPGLDLPASKDYTYMADPPEKVTEDVERLLNYPALPLDFSFVGIRLPQFMIDEGGNGGDCTNYSFALQSAYRMAYTHMSIDTTEEGIIENIDYSSYQSTGSAYGDMFTRPVKLGDRKEEAMDMLLYILDQYTVEELKQIGL